MKARSLHRRLGLLALAAALAWLLVLRGYADYLARPAADRALALNPDQPVALLLTAEQALADGRLDLAQTLAGRALVNQPFAGTALRLLGAVAEARGDRARALALMNQAVSITPRESAAQFWLAINALADKDVDAALARLDRLLRFEPAVQDQVFPILALIAGNPVGANPISRYLAGGAPWRGAFLRRLIQEAENSADLSRLFKAIRESGGAITPGELDQFAGRLFSRREWPRLRRLAMQADSGETVLLHDGSFDGNTSLGVLGWTLSKIPGVDIQVTTASAENRALHLRFLDRRVPFRNVSQALLLQPGSYRLHGRARSADLRAALGLVWELRCAENDAVIARSEPLLGTRDWHAFDVAVEVPQQQCGGQILTLVLAARIAAEQQVAGEAWYDDLEIQPTVAPDVDSGVSPSATDPRAARSGPAAS